MVPTDGLEHVLRPQAYFGHLKVDPSSQPRIPYEKYSDAVPPSHLPELESSMAPHQPSPPLPDMNSQAYEGFVRFLKEHASPRTKRVTAGGRIVAAGPNVPPPTFHTEFIDSVLQDAEQIKRQTGAAPEGLDLQEQNAQYPQMFEMDDVSADSHSTPFGPGAAIPSSRPDKDKGRAQKPLLKIPANWEVVHMQDGNQAAIAAGFGGYYRVELDQQGKTVANYHLPDVV